MNAPTPLDRKDLKVQALLNRVTSTENENAELRVEVHFLTEEINRLNAEASAPPVEDTPDVEEAPAAKKPGK